MPPSPDFPKQARAATLGQAGSWPGAAYPIAGWLRSFVAVLACMAVLLLAVWTVPPMLDWGRFRGTIASIAAARLGRPVSIGGEVTLRLLPRAVLTAADVTLPDQGDGISATIASLRLEVAVIPLLAGRLAPRDLVLGQPVLHLPWPLPETLAAPSRPRVPRAFAAHLDNGTLLIGGARVVGINAALHSGPEGIPGFGTTPGELSAQGFGAEGFAAFAGRSWRFTSALGAPDADGVSAVDLSVSGQGPAARTDATVRGTLADGVLQGRLVAGGPDLSLLLPAAAFRWHAEAPFVADGAQITSPSIGLSLGGSDADGALTLRLTRPIRLEGRLHADSIDLDGWAGLLHAHLAAGSGALSGLLGRVGLSADRAKLLGGMLGPLHGTVVLQGTRLDLEDGQAVLPGEARLDLAGTIIETADGIHVRGPATLDAPALRRTLAWLRPLAPKLADAPPDGVLTHARLTGTAGVGPSSLSVSGMSGEIDGDEVAGGFGASLGPHPHLGLGLTVSRLMLDPWLGALWPGQSPSLAGLSRAAATHLDTDVHLRARTANWHGQDLSSFTLDGQTGPGGLAIQRAGFDLDDTHVEASGGVADDGAVSDGALGITARGAAGLSTWLPADWHWAAPAWRGAATLNATLSGPSHDLAVQLRADASDLVLEADGRADLASSRATGSITLRHPGAPRLLAALGVAGAERWLGNGSLALRAQVAVAPDRVSVEDFDVRAADLGFGGHLALDRSRAEPSWTGALVASALSLPDLDEAARLLRGLPLQDLACCRVAEIALTAAEMGVGGRTMAQDLSATMSLADGAGLIDIAHATAFGGQASGQIAYDARAGQTALAARASLIGAEAAALMPELPVDAASGRTDISADLASDRVLGWPADLSGQATVKLRDITLTGFDAARAGETVSQRDRAAQTSLLSALSQGQTTGLSGTLAATLTRGRAVLAPSRLLAQDTDLDLSGWVDFSARSLDLLFGLASGGVAAPGVGVRLAGPWTAARAQPLSGPPAAHAATGTHPTKRGRPHP